MASNAKEVGTGGLNLATIRSSLSKRARKAECRSSTKVSEFLKFEAV